MASPNANSLNNVSNSNANTTGSSNVSTSPTTIDRQICSSNVAVTNSNKVNVDSSVVNQQHKTCDNDEQLKKTEVAAVEEQPESSTESVANNLVRDLTNLQINNDSKQQNLAIEKTKNLHNNISATMSFKTSGHHQQQTNTNVNNTNSQNHQKSSQNSPHDAMSSTNGQQSTTLTRQPSTHSNSNYSVHQNNNYHNVNSNTFKNTKHAQPNSKIYHNPNYSLNSNNNYHNNLNGGNNYQFSSTKLNYNNRNYKKTHSMNTHLLNNNKQPTLNQSNMNSVIKNGNSHHSKMNNSLNNNANLSISQNHSMISHSTQMLTNPNTPLFYHPFSTANQSQATIQHLNHSSQNHQPLPNFKHSPANCIQCHQQSAYYNNSPANPQYIGPPNAYHPAQFLPLQPYQYNLAAMSGTNNLHQAGTQQDNLNVNNYRDFRDLNAVQQSQANNQNGIVINSAVTNKQQQFNQQEAHHLIASQTQAYLPPQFSYNPYMYLPTPNYYYPYMTNNNESQMIANPSATQMFTAQQIAAIHQMNNQSQNLHNQQVNNNLQSHQQQTAATTNLNQQMNSQLAINQQSGQQEQKFQNATVQDAIMNNSENNASNSRSNSAYDNGLLATTPVNNQIAFSSEQLNSSGKFYSNYATAADYNNAIIWQNSNFNNVGDDLSSHNNLTYQSEHATKQQPATNSYTDQTTTNIVTDIADKK